MEGVYSKQLPRHMQCTCVYVLHCCKHGSHTLSIPLGPKDDFKILETALAARMWD